MSPWSDEPRKQEPMVTMKCPHCRAAIYMAKKELDMPTWTCPACKHTTRTS